MGVWRDFGEFNGNDISVLAYTVELTDERRELVQRAFWRMWGE